MAEVSDSELSPSASPQLPRPNRWTGPPSTWLSLTSPERGLATSLGALRDRDLSIHLYNAHSLKRRARRFWERKENGEVFDEEGEGMGWSPPKGWTAWPLPASEVPREGEVVGEDDGSEAFTLRRRGVGEEGASVALEDILVGIIGRMARERWEGRQWASEEDNDDEDEVVEVGCERENASHMFGVDAGEMEEYIPSCQPPEVDPDDVSLDETFVQKRSPSPEPVPYFRPIISADDDRSTTLLQPSVRHTLSQLDALLAALHHARQTCTQYRSLSAANTDDESIVASEPESPVKRPRGRPRKLANLALLPKQAPTPSQTTEANSADLFRAKKSHLGRPQKAYPRLEGENQQDYLIRIARIQKKPLPSFATVLPSPSPRSLSIASARSPSVTSSRSRKSSVKKATSEERTMARQKKLGLRDWSEVLGAAALVGFSHDVIACATQRCADLFGEGMTIMSIPEAPCTSKDEFTTTTYQPEMIPDFSSEDSSESDESKVEMSRISRKRKASMEPAKHSWFCPIEGCKRGNEGFEYASKLRRHLDRVHSKDEDEIEQVLDDTGEMEGAVHVDGFLRPMRAGRGLRGADKGVRKNRRLERSADEVEDEDEEMGSGDGSSSTSATGYDNEGADEDSVSVAS